GRFCCDPTMDMPCPRDDDDVTMALNLPALVVMIPLCVIPGISGNLAVEVPIFSVAVFFFWYFIGRWLDRTLGTLPPKPTRMPGTLVQAVDAFGLVACLW